MMRILHEVDNLICPLDDRSVIFVVKPDGVERNLTSHVKKILVDSGFYLLTDVTKVLTPWDVKILYKNTFEKDYPMGINDPQTYKQVEQMCSGFCTALLVKHKEIRRPSLYSYCRKLRGEEWVPYKCSPGSIRYGLRDVKYDNHKLELNNGFVVGEMPLSIIHATLNNNELAHAFFVFFQGRNLI